jgi:hypothetical protein
LFSAGIDSPFAPGSLHFPPLGGLAGPCPWSRSPRSGTDAPCARPLPPGGATRPRSDLFLFAIEGVTDRRPVPRYYRDGYTALCFPRKARGVVQIASPRQSGAAASRGGGAVASPRCNSPTPGRWGYGDAVRPFAPQSQDNKGSRNIAPSGNPAPLHPRGGAVLRETFGVRVSWAYCCSTPGPPRHRAGCTAPPLLAR